MCPLSATGAQQHSALGSGQGPYNAEFCRIGRYEGVNATFAPSWTQPGELEWRIQML